MMPAIASGLERAVPTLTALVLVAACSREQDAGPNSHPGPDGGSVGPDASAADGSHASPDGGTDDANVDGSGFTGVLPGDPASPARAAFTNVPAPPAGDADIVDNVIMSRLDVWLQPDATVGQVNSAVAGIGARVLSMTVGSSVISVAFPAAPDQATLEQKRQALEASPGILFAELAMVTRTEALPPGRARDEPNIGHLFMARFPAAWNLRDKAIKNCESRKVNVLVLDKFGAPVPPLFETELPAFKAPKAAGGIDHGWRVTSVVAAASFFDGEVVSGANPFIQCLNLQGVQAAQLSWEEASGNLWKSLPSGKVIVNVSMEPGFPPTCKNCSPSDFATGFNWLAYGIKVATDWRELAHGRDDDLLIAEAAGNDGSTAAGIHYALFRDAQIAGAFSIAASPRIFGSPRLTVFDDPAAFAPEPQFAGYPSLLPSADQRRKLLSYVTSHVPSDVGTEPNVVNVGATTRGEPLSVVQAPFSNSNADVYAVGTAVMTVGPEGHSTAGGTSFTAPQVAGLASYLWLLSDDLRNKPTSYTRQAIVENVRFNVAAGVHVLDAYASVLSLDAAEPVTPSSAPIRLALLDLNGDGAFTETDMQEFAYWLVNVSGLPREWDRHDLNGDGYSGDGTSRFDLDRVGSLQYGLASYSTVQESYKGQTMTFDETALTDLQILCYYAYSPLYTGDPAARDDRIGVACGIHPPGDGGGGADGGDVGGGGTFNCVVNGHVTSGSPVGHPCRDGVCNPGNPNDPCCCPNLVCRYQGTIDEHGNPLYLCEEP